MEAWRPKGLSRFDARTGFAVPEGGNAWIVWDGGSKVLKTEPNIQAGKPVRQAMGIPVSWRGHNWTVRDIWGFDDPAFQQSNLIVRDPRYYSCVGNMVLLPTHLKALTDSVPEVKHMLRVCAFNPYGWVPVIRDAPGPLGRA